MECISVKVEPKMWCDFNQPNVCLACLFCGYFLYATFWSLYKILKGNLGCWVSWICSNLLEVVDWQIISGKCSRESLSLGQQVFKWFVPKRYTANKYYCEIRILKFNLCTITNTYNRSQTVSLIFWSLRYNLFHNYLFLVIQMRIALMELCQLVP